MSIFANKTLKESTEKLWPEFSGNSKIKLKLSDKDFIFDDGKWKLENLENADISTLIKENKKLTEENNYLKLKIEVLLLMLAETAAETHLKVYEES